MHQVLSYPMKRVTCTLYSTWCIMIYLAIPILSLLLSLLYYTCIMRTGVAVYSSDASNQKCTMLQVYMHACMHVVMSAVMQLQEIRVYYCTTDS